MLLVLGNSYAYHFRSLCSAHGSVTASGWRGACVGDDGFRRWAIREAVLQRPQRVFLMVGGNDLARPGFRMRRFVLLLRELLLGLLAAGVEAVFRQPRG